MGAVLISGLIIADHVKITAFGQIKKAGPMSDPASHFHAAALAQATGYSFSFAVPAPTGPSTPNPGEAQGILIITKIL